MALEKWVRLDVAAVAQLRKERDELIQTTEMLCSECDVTHEERDRAFRECD